MACCTIYRISGAVLETFTERHLVEVAERHGNSVLGLKRHLSRLVDTPRFRLRLTSNGEILKDNLPILGQLPAEVYLLLMAFGPDKLAKNFAFSADVEQVRRWLEQPVCPNCLINSEGQSPLWFAADAGHAEVVELLIEAKAELEHTEREGATPLIAAARNGHVDCLRQLVAARGQIDRLTFKGMTALSQASRAEEPEAVAFLLQARADIEKTGGCSTDSPLWSAVLSGAEEAAALLVAAGANLNARHHGDSPTARRQPPIATAVSDGSFEVMEVLVKARANLNLADTRGRAALHMAAVEIFPEAVRCLLAGRADVNQADFMGMTPMTVALGADGENQILRLLLSARADPEISDYQQDTAMHVAARKANVEAVQLLLAKRADIHCRNKRGLRPVEVAAKGREPYGPPPYWGQHIGPTEDHERIVQILNEAMDGPRNRRWQSSASAAAPSKRFRWR